MTPVWGRDAEVKGFVTALTKVNFQTAYWGLAVVDRAGLQVGGVLFHDFTSEGVMHLSAAATSRRWLNRAILAEVMNFAFIQNGARIVSGLSGENNRPARKFWRAVGAIETLVPERWGQGEAMAIFILDAPTWYAHPLARRDLTP